MPESPDESIVLVPVPVEHLAAAYDYIARLMAPGPQVIAPARVAVGVGTGGDTRVVVEDQGPWDGEMVAVLRTALRERPMLYDTLDLIAASAPDPIWLDDIQAVLNADPNQLRAELATLSKISRTLFDGRKTWPMVVRSPRFPQETSSYVMDARVANWWRQDRDPQIEVMLGQGSLGRQIVLHNTGPERAWKLQLNILRDAEYREQLLEQQTQPGYQFQAGDLDPGKSTEIPLSFYSETRFRVALRWSDLHHDLHDIRSAMFHSRDATSELTPDQAETTQLALKLLAAQMSDLEGTSTDLARQVHRDLVLSATPGGDWGAAVKLAIGLLNVASILTGRLADERKVSSSAIVREVTQRIAEMGPA